MKEKFRVILSHQNDASSEAQSELLTADGQAVCEKVLDEETSLYLTVVSFKKLAQIFKRNPPVFIRHICPVQSMVSLTGDRSDIQRMADLLPELEQGLTFSVQTRILGKNELPYKPFDINQLLSDKLQQNGFVLDVKNPQQVLSLVIAEGSAYLGASLTEENLSSWAGGRQRFAKEEAQISRAEFKLMEAMDYFKIELRPGDHVLDLGAAPGGWSRVVLQKGARVTAVDPALLDERIAHAKGLVHYQKTAQEFLEEDTQVFDMILNDMRMEPSLSAQLMISFHQKLRAGGLVVMTLKLFGDAPRKQMLKALSQLENYYTVVGARQLFHNRSEVTVVLKK